MEQVDLAIIVASAAVIVVVIGILISDQRTRESNTLTRKELNARLRPWLRITTPYSHRAVYSGNILLPFEQFASGKRIDGKEPEAIRIQIQVVNFGLLPALDVTGRTLQSENEITRKELHENGSLTQGTPLLPQDNFDQNFDIPFDKYKKLGKEIYYFGIEVDYKINDSQKKTIGTIFKIESNVFHVADSWIVE